MATIYTNQTNLCDLGHPVVDLRSVNKPLKLRVPQDEDLPALLDILSNTENIKTDLSVAALNAQEREGICRRWLTLNNPLDHMNFIMIDTRESPGKPIGITGLGWIGPMENSSQEDFDDVSMRAGAAGVMVNPEARRKGFAAEALKIVIDYGLKELNLAEIRVGTPSSNMAMRGLMEGKFEMEPEECRQVDRFGNDLMWRINKERWSLFLGHE
ncbi:hypothetical protein BGW36DRAFT_354635 [Talaromyces proteolyticus]|uniref:N-acetyltransferase domain-containing protein n=1 Tax=Talaromyces proteolyticus TaxID=1131652 RepID=A0AAD4KZW8_9EURO|nr:uncharacterized protein BGW36DRAFT_354635 [Talaromyces proteolyticus]KAH8703201.1 hypothetical protein BGW36DRAFT_354635 [Talaromyces proteolyticus]